MTDDKIAHLTGKKARPRDWFVREALKVDLGLLTRTVIDDNIEYPPEVDLSKYQEPVGQLYQLYEEWARVDREIKQLQSNHSTVDEFGDFGFLADIDLSQFDAPAATVPAASARDSTALESPTRTDTVAASSVAPAATVDGSQAEFSAWLEERNISPEKKRAKSTLFGGERYGIRKANIGDTSVNKVFLSRLSDHHKKLLRSAHAWAYQEMNRKGCTPSTAQLRDKMVGCFDHWHVEAIKSGLPGGYGGYMRPQLVTDYLKELGAAAIGQQLTARLEEPVAVHLTHAQIDELSRDKARYWCKQMGLAVRGTVPELKLRLKEHFK